MRGLTYPDLAARYEIEACFDGCYRSDHWGGAIDSQGVVHWADRPVRRPGLRRFLILVSQVRFREDGGWTPSWPRKKAEAYEIYRHALWAYRTAMHDLGIRLPAKLAVADKAKVRALLATAPFELRNSKVGRWAGLR